MEQSELQRTARLVEMNRERFHEVQERIEQVINVSIGAGVTLTCQHPGGGEGTTIVDLGSGIFGERSWSDAAILTRERMEELGHLLENLQSQSRQLETTITNLAQNFTAAAEAETKIEAASTTEAPEVEAKPEPEDSPVPKSKRRRGGMFGNELTLDD